MKTISVGELRQNPTVMLAEVAAGETYRITRHGREVGRILPPDEAIALIPAPRPGGMQLTGREPHELRSAPTVEALLDDLDRAW